MAFYRCVEEEIVLYTTVLTSTARKRTEKFSSTSVSYDRRP